MCKPQPQSVGRSRVLFETSGRTKRTRDKTFQAPTAGRGMQSVSAEAESFLGKTRLEVAGPTVETVTSMVPCPLAFRVRLEGETEHAGPPAGDV